MKKFSQLQVAHSIACIFRLYYTHSSECNVRGRHLLLVYNASSKWKKNGYVCMYRPVFYDDFMVIINYLFILSFRRNRCLYNLFDLCLSDITDCKSIFKHTYGSKPRTESCMTLIELLRNFKPNEPHNIMHSVQLESVCQLKQRRCLEMKTITLRFVQCIYNRYWMIKII